MLTHNIILFVIHSYSSREESVYVFTLTKDQKQYTQLFRHLDMAIVTTFCEGRILQTIICIVCRLYIYIYI